MGGFAFFHFPTDILKLKLFTLILVRCCEIRINPGKTTEPPLGLMKKF